MRVLFINSVIDYGSTGKIVRDLANGLKEQGHEVRMAFGRMDTQGSSEDFIDIRDTYGTYWHLAMTRIFGRHGLHSKRATKKLLREIDAFSPDIVHLHNLHGYYLNVPQLLEHLKTRKCRVIITLHDCWLFSGSSAYFEYNGCKEWNDGCVVCNSTRDYPEAIFSWGQKRNFKWKQEALKGFDNLTIITPSKWLTDLASTTFLNQYEIKTIHNGIDLNVFKKTIENAEIDGVSSEDFVILGVSSIWERRKGLDVFIDLSSTLKPHEKLILIGLNDTQLKSIPDNVIGLKRTSNVQELVAYYNRADVFVNPTYEDNFPTTNLESLACGTPVITFNTGGSPEAVDARTGWITAEKSSQSIRNILDKIPRDFDDTDACLMRARDYFDKEKMIQSYLKEILWHPV